MFFKKDNGQLIIRRDAESRPIEVPLDDFSFISSVTYGPGSDSIILTAIHKSGKLPNLQSRERGDMRLYRFGLENRTWQQQTKTYSDDATEIPGSDRIAFYDSTGLSVVDSNGTPIAKYKSGPFNWGPPSVSVSPEGTRIAMVKWKGDDKKLLAVRLADGDTQIHRPSFFNYGWLDEDRIVYGAGAMARGTIAQLDLNTGATKTFLKDLSKLNVRDTPSLAPLVEFLAGDHTLFSVDYDRFLRIGDSLFFQLRVVVRRNLSALQELMRKDPTESFAGVLSSDLAGRNLNLICTLQERSNTESIDADDRGNILIRIGEFDTGRRTGRRYVTFGPDAGLLQDGWGILPFSQPALGFRYWGQLE